MTTPITLYITLQYLRTDKGVNKYHWGLYLTGKQAPAGILAHATDTGRQALDLYMEIRKVSDPVRSKTMVVCLKIGDGVAMQILDSIARSIPLMHMRQLPRGEHQWTCRVWVKEVLKSLHANRCISLPMAVDAIEQHCLATANNNIQHMGRARVYNDLSWLSRQPTVPMEIDAPARWYGPSPMETERSHGRYYGPSPMQTDTSRPTRYQYSI